MQLVLSFTLISITIYGVGCVQLSHAILGVRKDIVITHIIIIIKSEVSTFPIVFIFFHGCILRLVYHHILSLIAYTFWKNWDFVSIILVQFMMCLNIRIRYDL